MVVEHWDFVITAGQSQMVGHAYPPNAFFGNPPPPATNPLKSTEYINDPVNGYAEGLYPVEDPPAPPGNPPRPAYSGRHGSGIPAFVNTYARLSQKKVCVVRTAVDGTALLAANAGGDPHWDVGGTLFPDSLALAQGALDYIADLDAGDGYPDGVVIDNVSIIWSQGGKDAGGGNGINPYNADPPYGDSLYSDAQYALLTRYRTGLTGYVDNPSAIKLYIERMYPIPGFNEEACLDVQRAQEQAIALHPTEIYFGFTEGESFNLAPDKTLIDDNIHYAQRGLDIFGARFAEKIADVLDFPPAPNPEVGYASPIAILLKTAPSVPVLPRTFTSDSTWKCPDSVTSVKITAWGGGAGAKGGTFGGRGGGGGGAGERRVATISVTPGNTYAITIGAGGLGVNYNTVGNAGNGGDTTFGGSLVIAKGGIGPVNGANSYLGGVGGSGGTGGTGTNGGDGTDGAVAPNPDGGTGGSAPGGGAGGAGGTAVPNNAGLPGETPGGGGGGGRGNAGGSHGASGAPGRLIIEFP